MKIERTSENQIRCTLNKHDLMERQLKISELAYGSDKAKELFRDIMEQANIDLGFDADDIPLMIEAIPTSRDSIILLINKVDNPDELDERFSMFGPSDDADSDDNDLLEEDAPENSEDFINCFEQLHELLEEAEDNETKDSSESSGEFVPLKDTLQGNRRNAKKKEAEPLANRIKVFSFDSLNTLITLTSQIDCDYRGKNSLWKDPATKRYFLLLHRGKGKNAFRLMCSALAESAKEENVTYATQAYYNEHFRLILKDNALTKLADI